jgi:hypothetical protein
VRLQPPSRMSLDFPEEMCVYARLRGVASPVISRLAAFTAIVLSAACPP